MKTQPFPNVNLGGGITPSNLNDVYTHGQFFIPAGAMTLGATNTPNLINDSMAILDGSTFTVMEFPTGVQAEVFFQWAFKSDFVKTSALALKVKPLWYQNVLGSGNVEWEAGVVNNLIGSNLNISTETAAVAQIQAAPNVVDQLASGPSGAVEQAIDLGNTTGLSASNMNFMQFIFERHGQNVGDTFGQSALLLGLSIQWAVNFSNVAVWPVP
jgi:hypothetical protein